MKDDSLNDTHNLISKDPVKIMSDEMDLAIKQLQDYNYPPVSVGKSESVLEREIWNKAIEAAAQYFEKDNWITVPNQIRELKK